MIENTETTTNEDTEAEKVAEEKHYGPEVYAHAEHVSRIVDYILSAADQEDEQYKHADVTTPRGPVWHASMSVAVGLLPDPRGVMLQIITNPVAFLQTHISRAVRSAFHAGYEYASAGRTIDGDDHWDFSKVSEEDVIGDVQGLLANSEAILTGTPIEADENCGCKSCKEASEIIAKLAENGIVAKRVQTSMGYKAIRVEDEDREVADRILAEMGKTARFSDSEEAEPEVSVMSLPLAALMGRAVGQNQNTDEPETDEGFGLYL